MNATSSVGRSKINHVSPVLDIEVKLHAARHQVASPNWKTFHSPQLHFAQFQFYGKCSFARHSQHTKPVSFRGAKCKYLNTKAKREREVSSWMEQWKTTVQSRSRIGYKLQTLCNHPWTLLCFAFFAWSLFLSLSLILIVSREKNRRELQKTTRHALQQIFLTANKIQNKTCRPSACQCNELITLDS